MLGIAIFLFLGAWIIITLLCMLLGWFLGRCLPFSWGKWLGLFLGFMLPTGHYLVSWTAEYFMMQARVSELCKTQGGTKIYISPEAYRGMATALCHESIGLCGGQGKLSAFCRKGIYARCAKNAAYSRVPVPPRDKRHS